LTEDERLNRQYELRYRADFSARYHRRRAAFLTNLDTLLTLATLMAGASAFGALVASSPAWMAKIGSALVALISVAQVVLKLAPQGAAHAQWLKRWHALHTEIVLTSIPTFEQIEKWTREKDSIETECIGELRALTFDCEDATARAMGILGRQHKIGRAQRVLIHFGTFQQSFPLVPD